MRSFFKFFFLVAVFIYFSSCKKDELILDSSAKLNFSQDSVLFDTVFTTVGSTTKYFRVYNNNNQRINISNIRLAKGESSPFRFNADGIYGKSINNIEIDANDSIFVFVEVTVNPNLATTPLVIRDSLIFETNGNVQDVDLEAWGQDAYFHLPDNKIVFSTGSALYYGIEPCIAQWTNDKPHVVYGYRVVDSTCMLNIDAGTKVYFHNNAGIWVYRYGTLKVNGTQSQPVIFQGDRLEPEYADVPGQWDRIWINEGSTQNVINYAIIKNGFIGIQHEPLFDASAPLRVTVSNTIIQNMSGWGMFAIHGNIKGYNNLICNCGKNLLAVIDGGKYSFTHCTFANFYTQADRTDPVIYINNHDDVNGLVPLDSAYFGNCIFDGSEAEEIAFDSIPGGFNFKFEGSMLKTTINMSGSRFVNSFQNKSNSYSNPAGHNFNILQNSWAQDHGVPAVGNIYPLDLSGNSRTADAAPDIGAYEFQP
ncbi:MAG: choice-of-anchor Q domain-containing protein [Bacteroidota bacterium]|jgi:hypothetical protein